MDDAFRFADELGPAKIVSIYQRGADLRAIVVIDNVACGTAIGGVRMAADAGTEECFRLARAMTLKNAAAGLPHGGGKSVIVADPALPLERKERLIRAFACAIRDLRDYVPGPDMGTDERCMAWVKDEIGRAVGLPRELGGIPLDEIGATGLGLRAAAEEAQQFCDVKLRGARVAVQGLGAVGIHAARFLAERGARLVAAADSSATLLDPAGLDLERLIAHKRAGHRLRDAPFGERGDRDAVIDAACEIWIPAARPDVVRADNVDRLRARLVLEGANIPLSEQAERTLHERGVLVVPDFIANAGGVIAAAVEHRGGTERAALETIEERIRENTRAVLGESRASGRPPREVALALARERIRSAEAARRWHA